MFGDSLIFIFGVAACINGWRRGLSRSLRGLIATAAAVLATAYVYPALAAWLYHRVDLSTVQSCVAAYLIILFFINAIATIVLTQLFNSYWRESPWLIDRMGGFIYGGFKIAVIVVLAAAVSLAPAHLPTAPQGRLQLPLVADASSQFFASKALPFAQQIAESELGKKYILAKKK